MARPLRKSWRRSASRLGATMSATITQSDFVAALVVAGTRRNGRKTISRTMATQLYLATRPDAVTTDRASLRPRISLPFHHRLPRALDIQSALRSAVHCVSELSRSCQVQDGCAAKTAISGQGLKKYRLPSRLFVLARRVMRRFGFVGQ